MKSNQTAALSKPKKPAKGIKWEQHGELMMNDRISGHLPATMKFDKQALFAMLSRYKTVYLKPNQGAFGAGVMQVRMTGSDIQPMLRVHNGAVRRRFRSEDELYAFVWAKRTSEDYLVQQGIELLQWKKRPFDLRLMMTKQRDLSWKNAGFVGRAAHPDKIVTNIRSGGTAVSIENLLAPHANRLRAKKIIRQLNDLGEQVCRQLEGHYPGIRLFGIDMGLDQALKPWIIEVNTRPEKICWKCMKKLYKKSGSPRTIF